MIIAIKDREQKSVDLKFSDVSLTEFLSLCDMCKTNNLVMIISFGEGK